MGIVKIPQMVMKRVIRTTVGFSRKTGGIEVPWDGPDCEVVYNCSMLNGRQFCGRADNVIYTEQGYGRKQYYVDIGLYSDSILTDLYNVDDPLIEDDPEWVPSSKYGQPEEKKLPEGRPRCLLSQLPGDASVVLSFSPLADFETVVESVVAHCPDEFVIKKHPKLRAKKSKHAFWFDLSKKYNIPLIEFSSSVLNDFQQVVSWSSTAMIEATGTDLVQLAGSSIGTFLKARCPNSTKFDIVDPTPEVISSRRKRARWLLDSFCKPGFGKRVGERPDERLEEYLRSIRELMKWASRTIRCPKWIP
jgi:hypothetical protein